MTNTTLKLTNCLCMSQVDDGCSLQFVFADLLWSGMMLFKTRTQIFHHMHTQTHPECTLTQPAE